MVLARYRVLHVWFAVLWVSGAARGGEIMTDDPFGPGEDIRGLVETLRSEPRGAYSTVTEEERARARALAGAVVAAARLGDSRDLDAWTLEAASLGFELRPLRDDHGSWIVLADAAGDGRGLMIVRFGEGGRPVVLQAPHSFFDIGTGQLAAELMARSDYRVLQVNTRHRHAVAAEPGQHPPTDLAHRRDSWFFALTQGALDALEHPLLVQLHGFKRESVPDPEVDVIASCGASAGPAVLETFVEAMVGRAPEIGVARYPADISVLGGTANVQGRALAGKPDAAFLHLELGPEARKSMLDSAESLAALQGALDACSASLTSP